jgi:tRNA U34 5-methylaminomethyl-2-thiouridine-forming methyltransferase MnmC
MLRPVITKDGSHTLFAEELNEHYHSIHGALAESRHIFIRNGLECLAGKPALSILETGFGTGLNALLTAIWAVKTGTTVYYHALEKFPLEKNIISLLNYPALLQEEDHQAAHYFEAIHNAPWNEMTGITSIFHLQKVRTDAVLFIPDFTYDLVYYDAFSPEKQPEMWSEEVLRRIVTNLNPDGIFSTYCVKGSVRRILTDAGLKVTKVPGPVGKHETLFGTKTP